MEGCGPGEHPVCWRALTATPMASVRLEAPGGRSFTPSPGVTGVPAPCAAAPDSPAPVQHSRGSSEESQCGHGVGVGARPEGQTHRGAALGDGRVRSRGLGRPASARPFPANASWLPAPRPPGARRRAASGLPGLGLRKAWSLSFCARETKEKFQNGFIWITEGFTSVTKMEFTVCCYIRT